MKINELLTEWADPGAPCKHCKKAEGQHWIKFNIPEKNKKVQSIRGENDEDWTGITISNAEDHEYEPVKGYKPLSQIEAKRIGVEILSNPKIPVDIYDRIAAMRQNKVLQFPGKVVDEHIVKHGSGYRLLSHKGKNLGTFKSKKAAAKHEGEVEYFKSHPKK